MMGLSFWIYIEEYVKSVSARYDYKFVDNDDDELLLWYSWLTIGV